MSESRPSGVGTTLLVAGVVLAAALGLILLVPIAECPECEGGTIGVVTQVKTATKDEILGCTTCDDKTKVTLLKKWTYRRD